MGNITSLSHNNNKYKPNPKLQQMDRLLSHYYELKGMIYYNDGIGKFSEWCFDNEYDIDAISKQLKKLPEHCKLTEFDPNFPTSNNIDCNDRKNEIYQVIRYCWHLPNKFYMNVILNKESITNTYILGSIIQKQQLILNGYFKQEYHLIPNDIINICGLYFIINKQSLCINIKPTWWKPKSVRYDIALCQLAYDFVKNNEYFIAYQTISMIINNYDYHNHSSQTKARLHFYRGLVSTQWNSLTHAENDMKLAAELHSNCYYIHHYVKILFKKGKYKHALTQCLNCIKLDRSNARSHAWCALIYKRMNDLENALKYIFNCIELEPSRTEFLFKCADIYVTLKDYTNTKKYCLEAINLDPTNSDNYFQSAQLLEHFTNHNDAEKCYLKAIELNPKNNYRLFYASFLELQQKYDQALYQLNMCGNNKYLIKCAHLCEKMRSYDEARIYYVKAVNSHNPPKLKCIYEYANFLRHQMEYKNALEQYFITMPLLTRIKDKANCASRCAICYVKLKDYDNAKKYYLKAISFNERSAIFTALYAQFLCVTLNDFDNAKLYFDKAIALDSKDAKVYYCYAVCLRDNWKDYQQSEVYYKKCLAINGSSLKCHGSYGYLLYLVGKYEQSFEQLQIALKVHDESCWTHYYFGVLNYRIGNNDQANISMKKALELCLGVLHKSVMIELMIIISALKNSDVEAAEYHEKFEQLLQAKFETMLSDGNFKSEYYKALYL
eukprot:22636_1